MWFPTFPRTGGLLLWGDFFPAHSPRPWVIVSQFLVREASLNYHPWGPEGSHLSRNLADPSRRQPQAFGKGSLFNNIVDFSDPRPSTCRSLNSCCSVGSSGSLSSFKRQMDLSSLPPAGVPPGISYLELGVISHIKKLREKEKKKAGELQL